MNREFPTIIKYEKNLKHDLKFKLDRIREVGTCSPQKFRTTVEDKNVSSVNNLYDSFDIVQFYGEKQSCPYFPVNLGSHFLRLQVLVIRNSNLQFLFSNDLDELNDLRVFDVSSNPIEYFPSIAKKYHLIIQIKHLPNLYIRRFGLEAQELENETDDAGSRLDTIFSVVPSNAQGADDVRSFSVPMLSEDSVDREISVNVEAFAKFSEDGSSSKKFGSINLR
ncbi:CLUMA_CG012249, isoform A [Clunio marinus]|uniref:CLUMA_CG012249, isoform A n=1 Tax=Clunio marinus TaxID=568069 RepID=A0A1J1IEH9_9DIPT|nr:CLUMA_CG012249, isoform A [Clunio marinus]